ncbi:DUF6993 domain-containing protein [Compostimonas suwonensis]|nr:hypothetical protein [Compostimonas suwonensis]
MATVVVAAALTIGLAACTPPDTTPSPTETQTDSAAPSETPAPQPVFLPDLGATENLPFFDLVNNGVVAADANAKGPAFIDALAAAGFTKADMEVTFDTTSVNLDADSVQFAVRFKGECLVGQYGPASGGYHSMVAHMLATNTCLVGQTRQIDW